MARKPSAILTSREYEVMDAVWNLGEANVKTIREEMGKEKAGEYTSLATMLRYLEHKQMLTHRQEGKSFFYKATKSRLEVQQDVLNYILETFFDNNSDKLHEHLLSNQK